jgi:hypothetical protein
VSKYGRLDITSVLIRRRGLDIGMYGLSIRTYVNYLGREGSWFVGGVGRVVLLI